MTYSSYNITDPPHFNIAEYPHVIAEMELLRQAVADMPEAHKANILISFLKDHCINTAWIRDNPGVTKQVLSGSSPTTHIERLFASCRQNTGFLGEFEAYLKQVMSEKK